MIRVASKESPPSSKKLSLIPTCSIPKTADQIIDSSISIVVRGDTNGLSIRVGLRDGAANEAYPFSRSESAENASMTTNADGII